MEHNANLWIFPFKRNADAGKHNFRLIGYGMSGGHQNRIRRSKLECMACHSWAIPLWIHLAIKPALIALVWYNYTITYLQRAATTRDKKRAKIARSFAFTRWTNLVRWFFSLQNGKFPPFLALFQICACRLFFGQVMHERRKNSLAMQL